MTGSSFRRRLGEFALMLAVVAAAYWPIFHAGFIWDDDGHVTRPALRSWHGLGRIWFDLGATQQYYPVLHSAFWVEHRIWGDAALGYHLLNVVLHATAAFLFFLTLRRLWSAKPENLTVSATNPGVAETVRFSKSDQAALLAGLIFALHPVCVESAAWISEQKNTLSTVFYLLAALTYLKWDSCRPGRPIRQAQGRRPGGIPATVPGEGLARSATGPTVRAGSSPGLYWAASLCFILALLSKTVTATLPAALLVAIWWRRGTLSWRRDVLPLVPWFAMATAAGLFTAWVERTYIGAHGAHFVLSSAQRFLLAGRIVWFYLGKLVWPAQLIFVYPRWTIDAGSARQYLFPLGVILLLAAAWLARNRHRAPLAGLLFFVGSLFPVLGFFNVYPFVFSYVADHFQYLACLGVIALAAGGWGRLRGEATRNRVAVAATIAAAALLLAALGGLTWSQCRTYRDGETLFRVTAERNPASWLAQENLGVILANRGRTAEAFERYREAVRLNPGYAETRGNYGNALTLAHRWADAVTEYREALRLRPDFAPAALNWSRAEYGWASELANAGRLSDAIAHYEQALRLHPDYPEAMAELGLAQVYSGRLPEAVADLRQAVRLKPDSAQAHAYLGLALAQTGRLPDAVAEYRESLRLDSRDADVHYHLAMALRATGQIAEAAAEFEAARRPQR